MAMISHLPSCKGSGSVNGWLYLLSDEPPKLLALFDIFLDGGAKEGIKFLNRLWKWLRGWFRDGLRHGRGDRRRRGSWRSWRR